MRKPVLIVYMFLVISAFNYGYSQNNSISESKAFSLPCEKWFISLDLKDSEVIKDYLSSDGKSRATIFKNNENGLAVTVYLEENPNSKNIDNCRLYFVNKLRPKFIPDREIQFEKDSNIAYWNFFVEKFNNEVINHKNVNAVLIRDSVCINIHIARIGHSEKDDYLFDQVIRSVGFKNKNLETDSVFKMYDEFIKTNSEPLRQKILKQSSSLFSCLAYLHSVNDFESKIEIADSFFGETGEEGRAYALYEMGVLFFLNGEFDKTEYVFDQAIKRKKDNHMFFHFRGLAKLEMKKYAPAITDFTKALKLKEDFYPSYIKRAESYIVQKKLNKAISDLTRSIEIDSSNAQGFFLRGLVYNERKNYEKAVEDWQKAAELDPELEYNLKPAIEEAIKAGKEK